MFNALHALFFMVVTPQSCSCELGTQCTRCQSQNKKKRSSFLFLNGQCRSVTWQSMPPLTLAVWRKGLSVFCAAPDSFLPLKAGNCFFRGVLLKPSGKGRGTCWQHWAQKPTESHFLLSLGFLAITGRQKKHTLSPYSPEPGWSNQLTAAELGATCKDKPCQKEDKELTALLLSMERNNYRALFIPLDVLHNHYMHSNSQEMWKKKRAFILGFLPYKMLKACSSSHPQQPSNKCKRLTLIPFH